MTVSLCMKRLRLAASAGGLTLAVLLTAAGGAAFAQAQQEEDPYEDHVLNTDKRILSGILGVLGLGGSSNAAITYRERSPLVVPPDRNLPPPETDKLAKNPEWPIDPEVKERKAAAADAQKNVNLSNDVGRPLSRAEMARSGVGKSSGDSMAEGPTGKGEPGFFEMLWQGKLSGSPEKETGTFTGEPTRDLLTAPPPGYLTPSPVAPYGVTKRDIEIPKPEKKL